MANLKFSELPAASTPTGSEIVPVVQGGDSKRTTLSAIKTYVLTGLTVAWSAITGKPTTLSGYGITDAATSAQGTLADTATQPGDLATVATTGAYADLTGKPTILPDAPSDGTGYVRKDGAWAAQATGGAANWGDIGGDIADQDDLQTALGEKADTATTLAGYGITDAATSAQGATADSAVQPGDLSIVAITGAYADLSGRPTLATVATSGAYADLSGKPSLAAVATSGAYNDLTGKPSLGTAAAAATTDFATAAQGAKADTATQPAALASAVLAKPECLVVAVSDETTALTTGTAKVTFRMAYAFTVTAVRASLTTAQASGSILTVDINEGGTTILSTKLTIDNTEKTSTTAAAPPVISDASLADDSEITVDIDQIGNGSAKGLKIYLIGHQ